MNCLGKGYYPDALPEKKSQSHPESLHFFRPKFLGKLGAVKILRLIFCLITLVLASSNAIAQLHQDIYAVRQAMNYTEKGTNWDAYRENTRKPMAKFETEIFIGFKKVFASQDIVACPYSVTCSEYCLESMKSKGIFWGLLNGIERFSRCNRIDAALFDSDALRQKLIDNPEE